jgi:hypothetical protein
MHTCSLPYPYEGGERTCFCGQRWAVRKVKAHWKIVTIGLGETELEWHRKDIDKSAQGEYNEYHD